MQLIEFPYGDGLEIAFGGGRRNFFPTSAQDKRKGACSGLRKDGVNLVQRWKDKANDKRKSYIMNKNGLNNLDPAKEDQVLGRYPVSHMSPILIIFEICWR